jgi:hypothetical protein
MQTVFKFELDKFEAEAIREFCNSVEYCSIEQALGWTQIFFKSKICYFYLKDDSGIRSYCQIHESFGSAQVIFGPVCCEKEIMVHSINEIVSYYKKRHFFYLGIQMYYKSGYDTDYIEYLLNRQHKIKYLFNADNTKSSIELNLQDSLEEIYGRIRKGHKSDIKKAAKCGITVDLAKDSNELSGFIDVYSRMCRVRGISDDGLTSENINEVYKFLDEYKRGQILIVKDGSGTVIGGAIIIFQGISVRYFKGTTDPDRRDLPILHILIYDAVKIAKDANFKYFDFWGYNHFTDKNDQVTNINHFKKGFGGYYTFFAKKMNIDLVPNGFALFRSMTVLRNIIRNRRIN